MKSNVYAQLLQSFVLYAKKNFDKALEFMNLHGTGLHKRSQEWQDMDLEMVGQAL